jgi:H+/Cl- antiporter ClcA
LAASRFRSLRRSRWLALRVWRQRLVFWGGAIAIGCVSVAFSEASNGAQAVFAHGIARFWLLPIVVTPLGFAVSAALTARYFRGAEGSGIPQAIASRHLAHRPDRYRLLAPKLIIGKIGATLIGLLCGASVGREGPTVQVGAIIMLQVARIGGLKNERGLILAGSAAGIAAAFNAPLAGIVFAIEEMSRSFEQRTSGLVLYAVIFAGLTSLGLLGNYTYFGITDATATDWQDWLMVIAGGIIGGLAGGLFARLMLEITGAARRWIDSSPRRNVQFALACGVIVAITGILSHGATFGTGYAQARAAIEGHPNSGRYLRAIAGGRRRHRPADRRGLRGRRLQPGRGAGNGGLFRRRGPGAADRLRHHPGDDRRRRERDSADAGFHARFRRLQTRHPDAALPRPL